MSMKHRLKQRKIRRMIAWLVLALSVCVLAISGNQLWEDWQEYREADVSYEQLANRVRGGGLSTGGRGLELLYSGTDGLEFDGLSKWQSENDMDVDLHRAGSDGRELGGFSAGNAGGEQSMDIGAVHPDVPSATTENSEQPIGAGTVHLGDSSMDSQPEVLTGDAVPLVEIPAISIDFEALQAVNRDAVAWLYSPDTVIDYPVMRAKDYNYYLRHLPDGTRNNNGTLFIDYNWTDFSDELAVVYGHNMRSGKMFGSLEYYKKQAYFEEHPYLYLYTAEGKNYRVDLLYGCVIGAGQWRQRAFMFKENLDALLAYAAHNTTFISEAEYAQGDRVVALSACSYAFDNARYVVVGVLRPEYGEE